MARIRNIPILKGKGAKRARTQDAEALIDLLLKKPRKRRRSSPKQEKNNSKFKLAMVYAKAQIDSPESKAEYSKKTSGPKRSAFLTALSDYLNAPVVHYIKAPDYSGGIGNIISIKATDDFKVTAVRVTITDAAGKELEQGNAVQNPRKKHMWKYATTVVNAHVAGTRVSVVTYDKPENEGKGEVVIGAL